MFVVFLAFDRTFLSIYCVCKVSAFKTTTNSSQEILKKKLKEVVVLTWLSLLGRYSIESVYSAHMVHFLKTQRQYHEVTVAWVYFIDFNILGRSILKIYSGTFFVLV